MKTVTEIEQSLILLAAAAAAKSLQSCPALCDPIDGSPPGSSVPGTLQARTLEWVAIAFSVLYMRSFIKNYIRELSINSDYIYNN